MLKVIQTSPPNMKAIAPHRITPEAGMSFLLALIPYERMMA